MGELNKDELETLQDLLNEEIISYLKDGYSKTDEYVVYLLSIIKKLNLKLVYNLDKYA